MISYFGPLSLTIEEGFTGSQFERLGGEAACLASRDRFVAEDVVAVSMLSVNVPPRAALYLLADQAGTLPTDVDLVEASDEHLDAALTLWKEVHSLRDVGDTKTSKLLARKQQQAAVRVRVGAHPAGAHRGERPQLWAHRAVVIEQLLRSIALQPFLKLLAVFRVCVRFGQQHLM